MADGDIVVTLRADDKASDSMQLFATGLRGLLQDTTRLAPAFSSAASSAVSFIGSMAAGIGIPMTIGAGLYKLIDIYKENMAVAGAMRRTFGLEAEAMSQKAQELAIKTGRMFSGSDIEKVLVQTSDQFDRMGLSADQNMRLVATATGIASQRGLGLEEVMRKLVGAMEGNAKAARSLGLTLSDQYMQYVAYGGALRDIWPHLDKAEQGQYRLNVVFDQGGKYIDTAAQKAQNLANKWRIFVNTIDDLMDVTKKAKEAKVPGFTEIPAPSANMEMFAPEDVGRWGKDSTPAARAKAAAEESAKALMKVQQQLDQFVRDETTPIIAEVSQIYEQQLKYIGGISDYTDNVKRNTDQIAATNAKLAGYMEEEQRLAAQIAEIRSRPDEEVTYMQSRPLTGLRGGPTEDIEWTTYQPADTSGLAELEAAYGRIREKIDSTRDSMKRLREEQDNLSQKNLDRLRDEMELYSGDKSLIASTVMQKDLNETLDIRAQKEREINALLVEQERNEERMAAIGAGEAAYRSLQDRQTEIQQEIASRKETANSITTFLGQLNTAAQQTYQQVADKNQQAVDSIRTKLEETKLQFPDLDTAKANATINRLQSDLNALQESITRTIDAESGPVKRLQGAFTGIAADNYHMDIAIKSGNKSFDQAVDEMSGRLAAFSEQISAPARFDVETAGSQDAMDRLIDKVVWLKNYISQGAIFQIDVLGAMSPAVPFTQAYGNLIRMLNTVPKGMEYTIGISGNGGQSLSDSLASYDATNKYNSVRDQYQYWQHLATTDVSTLVAESWRNVKPGSGQGGLDPAMARNLQLQAQGLLPMYQEMMVRALAQYQSSMGASSGGSSYSASSGGSSYSSASRGDGVTFSIGQINIGMGLTGTARDSAIKTAVQIDKELAAVYRGKRSELRAEIEKGKS